MDPEDRGAYYMWSNGGFMSGQQYKGWDSMDDWDKEFTQRFDDTLDKTHLEKGITVSRLSDTQLVLGKGNKKGSLAELQAMEGRTVVIKGNMSCAAASEGLSIGTRVGLGESKSIEYKIHIPGGSKGDGAGMWIGDKRINGWGPEQREFMTNRDIGVKVGKTRYDSGRDIYITDLYFDGRMPHDYGTTGRVSY